MNELTCHSFIESVVTSLVRDPFLPLSNCHNTLRTEVFSIFLEQLLLGRSGTVPVQKKKGLSQQQGKVDRSVICHGP